MYNYFVFREYVSKLIKNKILKISNGFICFICCYLYFNGICSYLKLCLSTYQPQGVDISDLGMGCKIFFLKALIS